jgi:hypothetical protein
MKILNTLTFNINNKNLFNYTHKVVVQTNNATMINDKLFARISFSVAQLKINIFNYFKDLEIL